MSIIVNIFEYISNMGATIVVPLMFMLVALVFGVKIPQAFKIGLTIGIGFIGLNLAIGLFWEYLSPVAELLLSRFGLDMQFVDAGWIVGSAIGFASPVGTFIIPFAIAINIILLATNLTKTLNVDIWNFWHFAFYGGLVYTITGSVLWGYAIAGVLAAISLILGDIGAKHIEREMGVPGISVPQAFAASTLPLALALDKVYSKIPGLKDININPEWLSERIGVLGEPATIGFILGVGLGIIVGYDFPTILSTGLGLGALMFLLPRMVSILMEGLVPLSDAAGDFMRKRFEGKDFYIGLDSAITLANPTTIVVAILLVPITLIVATILPYNTVLPGADLAAGAYYVCFFSIIHRGDLVKTTISGTILIVLIYTLMTVFGPTVNELAIAAGMGATSGSLGVATGVNIVAGPLILFVIWFGNTLGPILMMVAGVAVFVLAYLFDKKQRSRDELEASEPTAENVA